jgi:hypothetical protein
VTISSRSNTPINEAWPRTFVGLIAQGGSAFEVLVGEGLFLVLVEALDLVVEFFQVRGPGHLLTLDLTANQGRLQDVRCID